MIDDRGRLDDIQEAIAAVGRYSHHGREEFERNELIQEFFARKIEIIGEAVKGLSPELLARHPQVPWREIARMRDVLIHHYRRVEWNLVWNVVEQQLPQLGSSIAGILLTDPAVGDHAPRGEIDGADPAG